MVGARLAGKIAIVIGAGQGPGTGMGNGRATALRFAQEGAKVFAVDRDLGSAEETAAMTREGGRRPRRLRGRRHQGSDPRRRHRRRRIERWGRIDILHNNVGVSIAGGDAPPTEITEEAFDRIVAINLRGTVMACKHVLPIMRRQRSGAIVNISSMAAMLNYPLVAYKATKAA